MTPAWLWYGSDRVARGVRGALLPLEAAYRAVVAARNTLYDAGWLRAHTPAIPAISVGNLTAGGTGKTPVAAHVARALSDAGARP
ncbi:MAG TPA: tetraacyldisaccharide 4'-kinase, partial [Gemmatimonadales bacterium]|nr:tetraacyldisaccharide 4'-kinase [Gemmatimonadales bacterium]